MHFINVILFQGGLGNQMFQYANAIALRKQHPLQLMLFDSNDSVNAHGGLQILNIFGIKEKWRLSLLKLIKKRIPKLLTAFRKDIGDISPDSRCIRISHHYIGYYQNESYFFSQKDVVRKNFSFNTIKLNNRTKDAAETIKKQNSISLHIRRGDYLTEGEQFVNLTPDYYQKSIDYIVSRKGEGHVYVFSDDIAWCKENIKHKNITFVDWNNGNDCWQDMYLMSCCKHNIIANSTFSWWGAYLNSNPSKIVIAPKQWKKDGLSTNIVPDNWIKI